MIAGAGASMSVRSYRFERNHPDALGGVTINFMQSGGESRLALRRFGGPLRQGFDLGGLSHALL